MSAAPAPIRIGGREFAWGRRTYVMGIVNVTPDSFSGDGVVAVDAALAQARQMEADGADLIDVGGESTRPETWSGAGLPAEAELARVVPVVEALKENLSIPISIDTYKASVVRAAVLAGAAMVNDVWGLQRDPEMAVAVAALGVPVVIMHNQHGTVYRELMTDIAAVLREAIRRAGQAGIGEDRIIIDPGIGFGKTREHNLDILRRLPELRALGRPILVGPSRKSFIGKTLNLAVDDRLEGTAAAVALAVAGGADLVRVHDVRAMVRVVRMADAIVRPRPHRVYLALGSNLGDRARYLARAREALAAAGIPVVRASREADTAPVGMTDQPRFLNQVLEVETAAPPDELLDTIKRLETELGRVARTRWGPREIDIDILLYGDRVINEGRLQIPHPELPNRRFALELLAELDPQLVHPVTGETVDAMLQRVPAA
jgi:dihydropteroate synthase/2-amino-4-hydroxy-6-hydroxymethyldihydropteridine diphosphokinase